MSSRREPVTGRGALGSVTREVLRQAPCPIVIVPPERVDQSWSLRQILLPHDGIPTTAAVIARAADLAEKAHAELAVLHIASPTTPPPGEPGALMAPQYLDQPQHEWPIWAREFMDRIVALGGPPPAVRMRLFFACSEPADAIVQFVGEHQTDLVIIAWVVGWEPEQRTTMRKVIDQAPGPLLIFPLEQPQTGMMF
jgi:nucleotide-binding universal stress UspA family protein